MLRGVGGTRCLILAALARDFFDVAAWERLVLLLRDADLPTPDLLDFFFDVEPLCVPCFAAVWPDGGLPADA